MKYKTLLFIFLLLLIFLGIALRFYSLDNEFGAEETDFVKSALAIKDTGKPVYYNSEQWPAMTALWHPPMYIFLLSLIFKISISEVAARSVNVLFSFIIASFLFIFCIYFLEKKKGKVIGLMSSAFFLINYYVLSSSIQIDIDMSSALFVFLFVFFILMNSKTEKNIYLVLSSFFLFLTIFNRYPMAFIAYVLIGIYYLSKKELRIKFPKYFLVGLSSFIAFVLVWGFYSTIIEPGNFLSFLSHNARLGGEQFSSFVIYFGSFLLNLVQFVRLFTLPGIILLTFSLIHVIRNRKEATNLLLIYSLGIFLFFVITPRPAFGYPRYFLTAIPAFSIFIGIFIYDFFANWKNINPKRIFVLGAISFLVSFLLLLLLHPQLTIYASDGLIKSTNMIDFSFNIFACLPLFFLFFSKRKNMKFEAVFILLVLFLSYSFYFDIGFSNNSTNIEKVGEYLKEKTNWNDVIIVPKAVGYYAERKFYLNDNNKPQIGLSYEFISTYLTNSFENREMSDEFFWPEGFYSSFYSPQPDFDKVREAKYVVLYHPVSGFSPEKIIGEFYVYKLNN